MAQAPTYHPTGLALLPVLGILFTVTKNQTQERCGFKETLLKGLKTELEHQWSLAEKVTLPFRKLHTLLSLPLPLSTDSP